MLKGELGGRMSDLNLEKSLHCHPIREPMDSLVPSAFRLVWYIPCVIAGCWFVFFQHESTSRYHHPHTIRVSPKCKIVENFVHSRRECGSCSRAGGGTNTQSRTNATSRSQTISVRLRRGGEKRRAARMEPVRPRGQKKPSACRLHRSAAPSATKKKEQARPRT